MSKKIHPDEKREVYKVAAIMIGFLAGIICLWQHIVSVKRETEPSERRMAASGQGHEASSKAWRITIQGGPQIVGRAEVRVVPDFLMRRVFDSYPTSFYEEGFDPQTQTLIIRWPLEAPMHKLCEGNTLRFTIVATAPDKEIWVGVPMFKENDDCEVKFVTLQDTDAGIKNRR